MDLGDPPLDKSWLGLLEECLDPCNRPKLPDVFAGLGLAVLTDPELPPLLLGDELVEFLPLVLLAAVGCPLLEGTTDALEVHLLRLEHLDLGRVEQGERCLLELLGVELASRLEESTLGCLRCLRGRVADLTELESSQTWKLACDWSSPSNSCQKINFFD